MANAEHVKMLRLGTVAWNAWRQERIQGLPLQVRQHASSLLAPAITAPDLKGADLSGVDLCDAALTAHIWKRRILYLRI